MTIWSRIQYIQKRNIRTSICHHRKKPWPPEIDWLDSYVNLSSYHPNVLQILALAYRSTKYARYASHSKWGCMLIFQVDPELADLHYMKYYANTNNTMYLCSPYFPMRPDMRRKYAQMYPDRDSMVKCYVVQPGFLKHNYQFGHWSYIFSPYIPVEWRVTVLTAVLICFIGLFGEYHKYTMYLCSPYFPMRPVEINVNLVGNYELENIRCSV